MRVILAVLAVFVVLMINEALWRKRKAHGEFSRKFVHVTVGCFVAFWPFFLTWRQIELLSLAFLLVVSSSRILGLFQAIRSVQRPTWGEACFALSVGIVAFATHNKWIYMAALLEMALADGLAAVVGVRFGQRTSYMFMGHTKSVAGTLTFFVASMLILVGYSHYGNDVLTVPFMVGLSLVASVLENASVQGLDNLLVPLVVALLLAHH